MFEEGSLLFGLVTSESFDDVTVDEDSLPAVNSGIKREKQRNNARRGNIIDLNFMFLFFILLITLHVEINA